MKTGPHTQINPIHITLVGSDLAQGSVLLFSLYRIRGLDSRANSDLLIHGVWDSFRFLQARKRSIFIVGIGQWDWMGLFFLHGEEQNAPP